jgi:flagellar biosynthesis/type III secretory pathway protein FliH
MCEVCLSWENVDVASVTVADLLAFDALPHDVKVICAKKIAHEIELGDDDAAENELIGDLTEAARREAKAEALKEIDELQSQIKKLSGEFSDLRDDREQDLCEAEDKGYRRGLAEGRRIARSEAAD